MNHHGGYGLLLALGLAVGYGVLAAGTVRRWSRWRTASFLTGCLLLMLATASAGNATFTTSVRQHLLVGMLAPIALVLGAPVTLLMQTLPVTAARRLSRLFRTRAVGIVAHPVTAFTLAVAPLPVLYLTPLYERIRTDATLHSLIHLHFLLAGYLFAWVIAGPDPAPRRPAVPARLLVLAAAVTTHAVLSQALYAGAGDLPVPAADRQAGATVMYYGGDLAELILVAALVVGWRPRRPVAAPATHPSSAPGVVDSTPARSTAASKQVQ
jgi:putative membrane protein